MEFRSLAWPDGFRLSFGLEGEVAAGEGPSLAGGLAGCPAMCCDTFTPDWMRAAWVAERVKWFDRRAIDIHTINMTRQTFHDNVRHQSTQN